jgi:hypothetical protein
LLVRGRQDHGADILAGKAGFLLYPCRFSNIGATFGPGAFSEWRIERQPNPMISIPPIAEQPALLIFKKFRAIWYTSY